MSVSRERLRTVYVCQECGAHAPKWEGRCTQCSQWNTLVGLPDSPRPRHGTPLLTPDPTSAQELSQIAVGDVPRTLTDSNELNRVLGGGIIPGSLILMAGDPGIGKSTILLQACSYLADQGQQVLYVSGEESAQQVKLRAERLSISGQALLFLAETEIDEVIRSLDSINPSLVVIDSIQTMESQYMPSAPGTVAQVRECTRRLIQWTKQRGIPMFLAGHVTKDGSVAGPRVLEHMVDVVLYLEGDTLSPFRILRAAKNRFGSTNEVGIFAMDSQGMRDVDDPSTIFLSRKDDPIPGSTVIATQEGTRPLLAEVQALTTHTIFTQPRRTANGADFQRLVLIAAVITKRLNIPLGNQDIIINIAGGLHLNEPAADLGIALAIISSFRNVPYDPSTVVIGEVGLGGEVRPVPQLERRLNEIYRLGFKKAVIPASQRLGEHDSQLELVTVASIGEAVSKTFPKIKPYKNSKGLPANSELETEGSSGHFAQ